MKKIVIAAALAVASLGAMAQSTVYGRINATVDSTKTGSVRADSIVNDISHVGISVKENLGGGLSARAVIETSVGSQDPVTTGFTQLGDRQSTVGLVNKAGSIDIGRNVHGLFTTLSDNDAFNTLYGSVAGDVHNLRDLRLSNGAFARVTALPGVTLGVDRTYTAVGNEATVYSAGTKLGPVNVGVAQFEQGAEKSTVVGANVKLGLAQISYSHSDDKSGVDSKGDLVGVRYPLGANVTAKASYGRQSRDPVFVIGPSASGPQEKTTAYAVGADYALSKRTQFSVAYRNVDKQGTSSDIKQVGVGVTHRF